jgi:hypothetical protein
VQTPPEQIIPAPLPPGLHAPSFVQDMPEPAAWQAPLAQLVPLGHWADVWQPDWQLPSVHTSPSGPAGLQSESLPHDAVVTHPASPAALTEPPASAPPEDPPSPAGAAAAQLSFGPSGVLELTAVTKTALRSGALIWLSPKRYWAVGGETSRTCALTRLSIVQLGPSS